MADLDPTRDHEQAGNRPALVVSSGAFNAGPAGLVIILPMTSQEKGIRSHVRVSPPEGGLPKLSFIKCEDIRSITVERLSKRLGRVTPDTMDSVGFRLRILIEL
jgi:mRNA interferase MazF